MSRCCEKCPRCEEKFKNLLQRLRNYRNLNKKIIQSDKLIQHFNKQSENVKNLTAEVSRLSCDNEALSRQVKDLLGRIEPAEREINHWKEMAAHYEKNCEYVRSTVNLFHLNIERMQKEINMLIAEKKELTESKSQLERKLCELEIANNKLESRLEDKIHHENLKNRLNSVEESIAVKERKNSLYSVEESIAIKERNTIVKREIPAETKKSHPKSLKYIDDDFSDISDDDDDGDFIEVKSVASESEFERNLANKKLSALKKPSEETKKIASFPSEIEIRRNSSKSAAVDLNKPSVKEKKHANVSQQNTTTGSGSLFDLFNNLGSSTSELSKIENSDLCPVEKESTVSLSDDETSISEKEMEATTSADGACSDSVRDLWNDLALSNDSTYPIKCDENCGDVSDLNVFRTETKNQTVVESGIVVDLTENSLLSESSSDKSPSKSDRKSEECVDVNDNDVMMNLSSDSINLKASDTKDSLISEIPDSDYYDETTTSVMSLNDENKRIDESVSGFNEHPVVRGGETDLWNDLALSSDESDDDNDENTTIVDTDLNVIIEEKLQPMTTSDDGEDDTKGERRSGVSFEIKEESVGEETITKSDDNNISLSIEVKGDITLTECSSTRNDERKQISSENADENRRKSAADTEVLHTESRSHVSNAGIVSRNEIDDKSDTRKKIIGTSLHAPEISSNNTVNVNDKKNKESKRKSPSLSQPVLIQKDESKLPVKESKNVNVNGVVSYNVKEAIAKALCIVEEKRNKYPTLLSRIDCEKSIKSRKRPIDHDEKPPFEKSARKKSRLEIERELDGDHAAIIKQLYIKNGGGGGGTTTATGNGDILNRINRFVVNCKENCSDIRLKNLLVDLLLMDFSNCTFVVTVLVKWPALILETRNSSLQMFLSHSIRTYLKEHKHFSMLSEFEKLFSSNRIKKSSVELMHSLLCSLESPFIYVENDVLTVSDAAQEVLLSLRLATSLEGYDWAIGTFLNELILPSLQQYQEEPGSIRDDFVAFLILCHVQFIDYIPAKRKHEADVIVDSVKQLIPPFCSTEEEARCSSSASSLVLHLSVIELFFAAAPFTNDLSLVYEWVEYCESLKDPLFLKCSRSICDRITDLKTYHIL